MELMHVERMMGVEPTLPAWEAEVLPMNYIRVYVKYITTIKKIQQKKSRAGDTMKLIIASNNAHKLEEIKAILSNQFEEIVSLREAGIDHETVEDGASFAENAAKKAREITEISGCSALADDSGLCVDALDGAPGIFSARYAGEHGNDAANRQKLLQDLKGIEKRAAHFTCSIVLTRPDGSSVEAEGYVYGEIAYEEAGEFGFGYDSLFYLPEYGCTMAQIPPEKKNAISHRHNALCALLEKLK